MSYLKSASLIAVDRAGLDLRRPDGRFDLTPEQSERIRRGAETLVRAGLEEDGLDVRRTMPVRAQLQRLAPGSYDLIISLHDARPLHRRLLQPRRSGETEELLQLLRNATETVLSGAEILPIFANASSAAIGPAEDDAGLVPMLIDGRYAMRVPWAIFNVLGASPEARSGVDDLKHLYEQDDSTITIVRGKSCPHRRSETVIDARAGLWAKLTPFDTASTLDSLETTADPLRRLVTREQRDDAARPGRGDVGPPPEGRRIDPLLPPPGSRL